ncbi:hypothetical protein F5B22DRAFT_637058 [Xylaria bambusicola]|uniref:uncharacterized protein n=1 Tax=Xylaria bambusicola TaxID=326684 RepID=UPI0020075E22|nr:uncharacterized protein F5B22DRAFT_637058 [Xylaria bambusicola]KAI0514491.1 hypothetical protein F5B22DRAFT_637058 [Xylaria bambusicola]
MNGNHLPAGQPMPGGVGGPASGPVLNGGRRRPPQPPYPAHPGAYHQHQQHAAMMYPNSYMNPYANAYYPPHPVHYQASHIPNSHYSASSYSTYPQQRSPPSVHQTYPPIVSSSMQAHPQPYPRPPPAQQSSPALSTPPLLPTAASPAPAPVAETPTSTQSSQPATTPLSPEISKPQAVTPPRSEAEITPQVFRPPLPWYSHPGEYFPPRATKFRRRRRKTNVASLVELPPVQNNGVSCEEYPNFSSSNVSIAPNNILEEAITTATSASHLSSEGSIQSSSQDAHTQSVSSTPVSHTAEPSVASTSTKTNKSTARPAVPAVPVIPTRPKPSPKELKAPPDSDSRDNLPQPSVQTVQADLTTEPLIETPKAPVLWTNFFKKATPTITPLKGPSNSVSSVTNFGTHSSGAGVVDSGLRSFVKSNASSLADALRDYEVSSGQKLAFLEPRGLVNTGNMCYMNSVLQALIFCTPFYDFLEQVSKKAAHSFNSETPLIDAMVMLLQEYKVISSAVSAEYLQKRLKSEELEKYGDAFTPEFVYEAMKRLPRFASMQRGQQQDAEEFLGFLLQAIGEECNYVMRQLDETSVVTDASAATPTGTSSPTHTNDSSEWLEVGRKQRAAITRSSGHVAPPSPITKIFTGQQRSALRVHGQKESVTFQSYQSLQLDIGDAHVNNIVDALKHMARPENMEFDPQRRTTKQVLIETLPPVLILHLKRFQFDPITNGTVKLWTKIDYPLELELPDEMFSPGRKAKLQAEGGGSIKYKLTAAVYHHGKSASGGHYTVDLRRQDDREWIRLDDTVIRRIRSEDVAAANLDKNTAKSAAKVSQKPIVIGPTTGNRFEGIGDEDGAEEEGWNKVTSVAAGAKKWSSVVNTNGPTNSLPAKTKPVKDNIKDNKVAYLLFYQRI